MIYKYECTSCELDIKKFLYKADPETGIEYRSCPECGEMLKRKFMRPPTAWFNQIRRREE